MGQWLAGFESRLVPSLPLPFIPTLIGLRAFDLVSSRVWWEATTNNYLFLAFWPARSFFYPSVSGGLPPRLLPPSGGLGLSPGAWGAPNKGNADGAEGILGNCRMRVDYGPAPGPTIKKALCHTCPFGGAGNKYRFSRPLSLLGLLASEFFILRSQGAFPPGFYLLRKGWVYRPAP